MTYETIGTHILYEGPIFTVRKDAVVMPGGSEVWRDVVDHRNAVAVVALAYQSGPSSTTRPTVPTIALVYQYRHPLGKRIWELPAGLQDHLSEHPRVTAARELKEEAGVIAEQWDDLVTIASSPGFTDEYVQVFLATELERLPRQGTGEDDEEADLEVHWIPLEEAVKMVEGGVIVSAHTVAGILAAARKVGI